MKAQIIEQTIVDSAMDMVHGGGYRFRRLLLPNGWTVAMHHSSQLPFVLEEAQNYDVIEEVDIPDGVFDSAQEYLTHGKFLKHVVENVVKQPDNRPSFTNLQPIDSSPDEVFDDAE